jgi:hypothetical protein
MGNQLMMFRTLILSAVVFLPVSMRSSCAGPFLLPEPCRITEIVHVDFADSRIPDDGNNKLLPSEDHLFRGTADDLNRFLETLVQKPLSMPVTVTFTGPSGRIPGEPLTPEAAQSGCCYDWAVQIHWWNRQVTVSIPLAARIPFGEVHVPVTLPVESGVGAPPIVKKFAQLHNERRADRSPLRE